METLKELYEVANSLGITTLFWERFGRALWIAGLVLALLNCLLGYTLRRLWSGILGFILGFSLGYYVSASLNDLPLIGKWSIILGMAFFIAFLGALLYKVGLFILATSISYYVISLFVATDTKLLFIIKLIISLVIAALTLWKEKIIIQLVTAIGGGFFAAWCIILLSNSDSIILRISLTVMFAGLGILIQTRLCFIRITDDEDEDREKRSRRKKKARKARKKCTDNFDDDYDDDEPEPIRYRDRHPARTPAYNNQSEEQTARDFVMPPTLRKPEAQKNDTPLKRYEPDLSDVRLSLSKEVSEILEHKDNQAQAETSSEASTENIADDMSLFYSDDLL